MEQLKYECNYRTRIKRIEQLLNRKLILLELKWNYGIKIDKIEIVKETIDILNWNWENW